jgi:hypothetical protein
VPRICLARASTLCTGPNEPSKAGAWPGASLRLLSRKVLRLSATFRKPRQRSALRGASVLGKVTNLGSGMRNGQSPFRDDAGPLCGCLI